MHTLILVAYLLRCPDDKQNGQGFAEYALILALVFLVVLILLFIFGPAVGNLYSNIMENMQVLYS